jgi:hypothetical protein
VTEGVGGELATGVAATGLATGAVGGARVALAGSVAWGGARGAVAEGPFPVSRERKKSRAPTARARPSRTHTAVDPGRLAGGRVDSGISSG